MPVRLTAFASLAGELGSLTFSMGGLLLRASIRPQRAAYYEDSI